MCCVYKYLFLNWFCLFIVIILGLNYCEIMKLILLIVFVEKIFNVEK